MALTVNGASGGNFVDIDKNMVNENDDKSYQFVRDKFDLSKSMAEESIESVLGYLGDLNELIEDFTFPDEWRGYFDDVVINPIDMMDWQDRPAIGDIELPDNWPANAPRLPPLTRIPGFDLEYTTPTFPPEISATLSWIEGIYNQEFFDVLEGKLRYDIENGGTGLSTDVRDLIVRNARNEQRDANERLYQSTIDAIGEAGFNLPDGAIADAQLEIARVVSAQETQINNTILIQDFDLAQKNTHFSIEKGVMLEQILRNFYTDQQNRSLDAAKADAQLLLDGFAAKVKGYLGEWEGIELNMKVAKAKLDVVIESNRVMIEGFEAEIKGYVGEIDGLARKSEAISDGYKAEAAAYASETSAQAAMYSALLEVQKAELMQSELELKKITNEVDFLLNATVSINSLKEKAVEGMAGISGQLVASSLNGASVSSSYTFGGTGHRSESWGHHDSLGETHSYQE